MMTTKVCIIGGSGFVGHAIVRQAIDAGYQVTIACRHPERARHLLVSTSRLLKTDITDGSGLAEAVAGNDCVINLVGLLFERGRYSFDAAHVKGTENILLACQRAGISQYLHMSALGAGEIPESRYSQTKGEAEEHVRQSELDWTIFRPSIIYGEGDSFFNKFKAMTQFMPILPVIAGNTRFQPVWVEDVARAFVQSIGNKHVAGQIYTLAGPKSYSFMELMRLLMKSLGRYRLLIAIPDFMARIMAAFMQHLPVPPLTTDQFKLLQHDNVSHGEPFPELFGQPADLETILPGYIRHGRAGRLQTRLNQSRSHYRKLP